MAGNQKLAQTLPFFGYKVKELLNPEILSFFDFWFLIFDVNKNLRIERGSEFYVDYEYPS